MIEFQNTPVSAPNASAAPQSETKFRDDTYSKPYQGLQVKFQQKLTWLRALPAIKGSKYGWIMKFKRFHDNENRFPSFVDPSTFGQASVFERARQWFLQNDKAALYSVKPSAYNDNTPNPNGFRFYSQDRGLMWVINAEEEEGKRLRLLNASLYDGERGGTQGLGSQIWSKANEVDNEPGSPTAGQSIHGDITSPTEGRLIGIEKSSAAGADQFVSYAVKIGKATTELDMAPLTEEEVAKVCPLEEALHIPSEEEQKEYLKAYIGEEKFKLIFP